MEYFFQKVLQEELYLIFVHKRHILLKKDCSKFQVTVLTLKELILTGMESDHNREAGDNYDDICLKTERLSPEYRSEDGPTVENGLMMPTLPSTPLWDEEDRPPQEQKLKAMPVRVQRLCMVVLCGTSFDERMFQNLLSI